MRSGFVLARSRGTKISRNPIGRWGASRKHKPRELSRRRWRRSLLTRAPRLPIQVNFSRPDRPGNGSGVSFPKHGLADTPSNFLTRPLHSSLAAWMLSIQSTAPGAGVAVLAEAGKSKCPDCSGHLTTHSIGLTNLVIALAVIPFDAG